MTTKEWSTTSLRIDKNLRYLAKSYGLNLSKVLEKTILKELGFPENTKIPDLDEKKFHEMKAMVLRFRKRVDELETEVDSLRAQNKKIKKRFNDLLEQYEETKKHLLPFQTSS